MDTADLLLAPTLFQRAVPVTIQKGPITLDLLRERYLKNGVSGNLFK